MRQSPWRGHVDEAGQSSVEYTLVLFAFVALVVGLGAVWHAARDGRLLAITREATSHNASEGAELGLLQDITAY